jgi:outer membrane protein assembly factor BamB
MPDARRRFPLFPLIVIAITAAVLAWQFATDHFARSFAAMALPLLAALIIGLWWALRTPGRRLKRLAVVALVVVLGVLVKTKLLRYDGSADGTALPSFSWVWTKRHEMPALHSQPATSADLGPVPAGLADWTRFMGPNGDGMLPAPKWNTDWKSHPPREVWRQPIGVGWSGFAVLGRRAFTQEQRGDEESVTCYDVATGKLLWSHADKTMFKDIDMSGPGPRATPTVHPESGLVFTMGATGILNCLELTTGALRWSHRVLEEAKAGNIQWGKSNSPLLHGDMVIVNGGTKGATLLSYRQKDGELVWKSGEDAASYSTPTVLTLAGREQVVSVNQTSVTGHDIATGTQFWSFPWPGNMPKVTQAIPAGADRILVTASYGMKSHLLEIKQAGEGFACNAVWTSTAPRTKFSSATVLDGQAYALDEGMLVSVDLATGERGWREGRYGYGQHLQLGDVLLIQAEDGSVVLVRANKEKPAELGRIKALSSKTWNPPTLAGNWLLVRNDREAVCYELR